MGASAMINLTFYRASGQLYSGLYLIGLCYSGNGLGLNNPQMENQKDTGPIPAGIYILKEIVDPYDGPEVFELIPDPSNIMYNRDGFRIHWDNKKQNFSASKGCIVPVMPIVFTLIHNGYILEVK